MTSLISLRLELPGVNAIFNSTTGPGHISRATLEVLSSASGAHGLITPTGLFRTMARVAKEFGEIQSD